MARIELEMNGRPTVSIPVEQAKDTVRLPRGREIVVEVRDAQGAPVAGAIVTARYEAEPWPGEVPRTEPIEVESHATAGGDGLARVAIPKSGKAQVLVEAEGRAPVVVDLGPSDGSAPVEVVLAEGLQVPVRVLGADGKALAGAQVVARAVVRGMRVERKATTAADGRASVGPLGPGPVEVYANADGQAWAVATAVASSAMGTVELRLARGATLRLVVDDPSGLALEGVSVHATPDDDGPGDVVPPGSQPWRTDAGGVLVVEHLPERAYKMRLSLPGYRDQMLRHVWPGHVTYFATLAPNP